MRSMRFHRTTILSMSKKSLNSRTLIILSLIYSSSVSYTQTPLNVVSEYNYHQQNPHSIIEIDGRIYTAGIALTKDDPSNRELFFVEYDQWLKPISNVILKEEKGYQTSANNSTELLHYDGKFYKGCHEDSFGPNGHRLSYGFIAQYDVTTKEVEYFHKIQDTTMIDSYIAPESISLKDTGLLTVLYSTGVHDLFMQTFDLSNNGQLLNVKRYADGLYNYFPGKLLTISDFSIALGSFADKITNEYLGTFIWEFDESLNVIKQKIISNPLYRNHEIHAVVDHNHDIVIAYNEHEGDFRTARPLAIKMDSDLNILWERPIGDPIFLRHNTYYAEVVESHQKDGYLFCGHDGARDSISEYRGQIAKLSLDGDSIWHRKYIPFLEKNQRAADFEHMTQSNDGNYLVCGSASNSNAEQDSIYFLTWMLKIDEDGHIVLADTSSNVTNLEEDRVRIFPNPTSEWLYIEHDDIDELSYSLYDSQGRLAVELKNLEAHTSYMIDVSTFHSGLYYLHIIDSHRRRQIETIVIE